MKRNCAAFIEELAGFVSDSSELSEEAAAHVQSCAHCRERITALNAVAAMHRKAASSLTEPTRRLGSQQLKESLVTSGRRSSGFEIHWRPVLAGALGLALILGVALIDRRPRGRVASGQQTRQPQSTWQAGEEALKPSLLALRREVEDSREPSLDGTTGPALRPYRLRDALAVSREQ